jgi:hypothetical protein
MDEHTYAEAVRRLRVGGWRYIEFGEIDAIETAAEARQDLATLILVDVMMERDDTFSRRFNARIDGAQLTALLDQLAEIGPFDELWHVLFGLVERDPCLASRRKSRTGPTRNDSCPGPGGHECLPASITIIFVWCEIRGSRENQLIERACGGTRRVSNG